MKSLFSSLHSRLLSSYLFLLIVTLAGIFITLFITIGFQPVPPQSTYNRLLTLSSSLNFDDLVDEFSNLLREVQAGGRSEQRDALLATLQESDEWVLMDAFAIRHDVRVMIVNLEREEIFYDSAGEITEMTEVRLDMDNYRPRPELQQGFPQGSNLVFGEFEMDDGNWLFSGYTTRSIGNRGFRGNTFIVADATPTDSLQNALSDFTESLAQPVLQSALIGLIIAIVLATLISRTIARPLQAVSEASSAIAQGDLEQAVPVSGPTEVRTVAESFNTMSAEVRSTQQAQRDFVANVSHDLKTPLTSIQGFSMAIMDGTAKDVKRAAEIIHDEASRLNRMVVELTDLARLEAGSLSMQMTKIDLSAIANVVAQQLTVMAEEKHITLHVHTPELPKIAGDGDRLVQVFNNLIGNAIKYTPKGGDVYVRTQSSEEGGVEAIIQDNGDGIPQRDLSRIFQRFYQVDKARGPERGTGLGLAITHEIVLAHGGKIHVKSGVGQGTRFTVWFPDPHSKTQVNLRLE